MKIVNFEVITNRVIVMTGRNRYIRYVAEKLVKDVHNDIWHFPRSTDYFEDYPKIISNMERLVEKMIDELKQESSHIVIATQSDEFIERLLDSSLDFQLVTVYCDKDDSVYRLRVLDKETAIKAKREYGLEMR